MRPSLLHARKFSVSLFILFSGLLFSYPLTAAATADALYVNHVTRQLAVFSDDELTGIFWKPLAAEQVAWERAEREYSARGYTYTRRPLLFDGILLILLASTISLVVIWQRRRARRKRRGNTDG